MAQDSPPADPHVAATNDEIVLPDLDALQWAALERALLGFTPDEQENASALPPAGEPAPRQSAVASTTGAHDVACASTNTERLSATETAVIWRAMSYREKLLVSREGLADSKGCSKSRLFEIVDIWGDWKTPVPGHQHEYHAQPKLSHLPPKPLWQAAGEYRHLHGPIVDLDHFMDFLKAAGVRKLAGWRTIVPPELVGADPPSPSPAASASSGPHPPGNPNDDSRDLIEIAEQWRALPDADKLAIGFSPFAVSKRTTREALIRYVSPSGRWMLPVAGHEHEYHAQPDLPEDPSPKRLRDVMKTYRERYPGPIVLSHLAEHLRAHGIENRSGRHSILTAAGTVRSEEGNAASGSLDSTQPVTDIDFDELESALSDEMVDAWRRLAD